MYVALLLSKKTFEPPSSSHADVYILFIVTLLNSKILQNKLRSPTCKSTHPERTLAFFIVLFIVLISGHFRPRQNLRTMPLIFQMFLCYITFARDANRFDQHEFQPKVHQRVFLLLLPARGL